MATLSEITDGHSKRISRLTQRREDGLREALAARDRDLRAMPATAKIYGAFEAQIAEARARQLATEARAETARADALQEVSDRLADALADAQRARREARRGGVRETAHRGRRG